jgi:hypothetical protein
MIDKEDMVSFAQSLGALTKLLPDQVCVMVGEKIDASGMRCYSHAVFLIEGNQGWAIGFSQFGRTRILSGMVVQELLRAWVSNPNDRLFDGYLEA